MPSKPMVDLWTDGSSTGVVGAGGWAVLLRYAGKSKEFSGSEPDRATNNSMEMRAVLEGLKALKQPCRVTVHTDSQLVIGWMRKEKPYRCKKHHIRILRALIREAIEEGGHVVEYHYVKGHNGNRYNERVDKLARAKMREVQSEVPVH